ncbi:MAG: GIY-YIG nuclease family protein [Bacteroidetes bacterium]|nr:GIY-YIG nuclease family protein [Bacteroidota bacterium]
MKIGHNYYVYILECSDKSYYTGVTNDIDRRLEEHNSGENPKCYTYNKRPVVLKYYDHFLNINDAINWEKQIKGWSRKKKEALFESNWKEIQKLAKNRQSSSSHPSTGSG